MSLLSLSFRSYSDANGTEGEQIEDYSVPIGEASIGRLHLRCRFLALRILPLAELALDDNQQASPSTCRWARSCR